MVKGGGEEAFGMEEIGNREEVSWAMEGRGGTEEGVGTGTGGGERVGGVGGSSRCSMKETWKELNTRSEERSQRRYALELGA